MSTIYVNQNGTGDYTTIQAAVAAAAISGDRILIAGGTYTGPIDIQGKSLTLQSFNAGTDPSAWTPANIVTTDRIISNSTLTIDGIAVIGKTSTGDGTYEGVEFDGGASNSFTIRNSTVSVQAAGVPADQQQATGINISYNSGSVTIDHVKVSGFSGFTNPAVTSYAVFVNGSTDASHPVTITNSTLDTGTPRSTAVAFDGQVGGSQVQINGNTFGAIGTSPGALRVFDFGDVLTSATNYSGIKNNTFSGTPGSIGQVSNETNYDGTNKGVSITVGATTYTGGGQFNSIVNASDASGAQTLLGSSGNNLIIGSVFDDVINGAGGSDVINGGGGVDTVTGFSSNASVSSAAGQFTVVDGNSTTTLSNVEKVTINGATTLLVGNGGFATIQAAVAAANSGDRILIAGGVYAGPIDIAGKNLTLQSFNAGIDPSAWSASNTVTTDRITSNSSLTIDGIAVVGKTVTGDGLYEGIESDVGSAGALVVKNSTVSVQGTNVPTDQQQATGINISGNTASITIDHVQIGSFTGFTNPTVSSYAVFVNGSSDSSHPVTITNSTLGTGTPRSIGLALDGQVGGTQINVSNNTFTADGTSPGAIRVFDLSETLTQALDYSGIKNNTFTGAPGSNGQLSNETNFYGDPGHGVLVTFGSASYSNGAHFDDVITAAQSNAALTTGGTAGSDLIIGSAFADMINGGNGNDTLNGGGGNDTLTGGAGADTFVYATGGGADSVTDFSHAQRDVVDLRGAGLTNFSAVKAATTQSGSNAVIQFSDGGSLTLQNVTASNLVASDFLTSANPTRVAKTDFNADSVSDILFRNASSGAFTVDQLSASEQNSFQPTISSDPSYQVVGTGDFNADGKADILFRNASTGNFGYEDLSVAGGSLRSVGSSDASYAAVGIGDFNDDGRSDVLFRNNSTGVFGVDFLNSDGSSTFKSFGSSNAAYTVAGVGDFNGDGIADVLFRNSSTGDFGVDLVNSDGSTTYNSLGASNAAYSVVGVADYNGDGRADVLFRNNSTGDFGASLLNVNGSSTYQSFGGSDASYAAVGTGDYNADGLADVLFRNASTGAFGVDTQIGAGGGTYASLGTFDPSFAANPKG